MRRGWTHNWYLDSFEKQVTNNSKHNALDDALATLQLFYAQLNELGITLEDSIESLFHTNAVGRFSLGLSSS